MPTVKICLFIVFSLAMNGASAASNVEQRLKKAVEAVLPDVEVTQVAPGPIAGIYEVMIGPSLLYVSEDGRYIFKGDVFDLESLENISKRRRAAARTDAFASLDPKSMIEFSPGASKVKRTVYVYTDIDCGYCRKMHLEVKELNAAGIAVRYLAYPRAGLQSDSYDKAVAVWCSVDRQKALTASKAGEKVSAKPCKNPVADHYRMGDAMGVRGTPAVYGDDGESIGGYVPAHELIRMLTQREG